MWLYWFVQLFVTKVEELKDHSAPSKIFITQQTLRQPSNELEPELPCAPAVNIN